MIVCIDIKKLARRKHGKASDDTDRSSAEKASAEMPVRPCAERSCDSDASKKSRTSGGDIRFALRINVNLA